MNNPTDPLPEVSDLLDQMADELRPRLKTNPIIVGVQTGGAWVADALQKRLSIEEPVGWLDITFYRDDFSRIGLNPKVQSSHLPVDVEDRHIILVDDVLQSGRTIRAAINEIFDYGRPASVKLAILVERGGRELPIQADVKGMQLRLEPNWHIRLSGPDNMTLSLEDSSQ